MARGSNRRQYRPYGVTRSEQSGLDKLYGAFSHSAECDEYFSASAMESVDIDESRADTLIAGTSRLLPGGEVEHKECSCWCHAPEFDKDAPPDGIDLDLEVSS